MSPACWRTPANAANGVRILRGLCVQGASPLATLCRPARCGAPILPRLPPRGNFPPLRPQGVLHHGRSPFFTTGNASSSFRSQERSSLRATRVLLHPAPYPCPALCHPQECGAVAFPALRAANIPPAHPVREVPEGRSFEEPEPRRSNIGFADIAKTGCTHRVQSSLRSKVPRAQHEVP